MQYYDSSILQKSPETLNYFQKAIEKNNLAHCLLFWGPDITSQCQIALEIARLLNCKENGSTNCECLNCRWIKEQTHPAVKIYTRLDFKEADNSTDEESSSGKKNINVAQARSIISELTISSDYHRVYIFCDRDEDGNLLPLNQLNFPEVTSNALLKTFEEPPQNTTFIFLTKEKTDVISTVVSRAQSFFIPAVQNNQNLNYELVQDLISDYWTFEKGRVLEFANDLLNLASENDSCEVFGQIENYMHSAMLSNFDNKQLFYKLLEDITQVETAKRQASLTPPMNLSAVCENLSYKLFL